MRRLVVILFFACLVLSVPLGLIFRGWAGFRERPFLSPLPSLSLSSLSDRGLYRGVEDFLDDRHPLRGEVVMANSWLDMTIFGASSTHKIRVGRDGWLFYGPALHDFAKDDCSMTPLAYRLARRLQRLEQELEHEGKRFVFVVAPDKATIYPQYVGGVRPVNSCNKSFYDLFLLALRRFPVRGFVRLDTALRKAAGNGPVYHRMGTHWNDRGAAVAAGLILRRLSGKGTEYGLPPMRFRLRMVPSECAAMLSLAMRERTTVATKVFYGVRVQTQGISPMPFLLGKWRILRTRVKGDPKTPLLPKALIYRDSFMTAPLRLMKGSFREIYARWSRLFPEMKGTDPEELRSARIVILEIVERNLPQLSIRLGVMERILHGRGGTRG